MRFRFQGPPPIPGVNPPLQIHLEGAGSLHLLLFSGMGRYWVRTERASLKGHSLPERQTKTIHSDWGRD